ncbi:CBD9-like protein [Mycena venus]|uniref:CBD9-like protein n=1 Tax=Mycena venus TaxID=2733690 RepID=A0A8H6YBE1_9AGAR|nr:CBD9-like protein [Mycena venus]
MTLLFFLGPFPLLPVAQEFSKRDATGDSICTAYMCIAAVVNGSTVQYTLTGTGKRSVGWMGMGFGTQMSNTPMVIMWGNSNGSVTLSQRQAPTTLSETLSTTSGNSAFVYTIPANSDTKQSLIYAFGTTNPGSSDPSATLQQHLDSGPTSLDLTKSLSSSTPTPTDIDSGDPIAHFQHMVVTHAILCVVGFALLLPSGVLLARYLRTFTPHLPDPCLSAGPVIIAGVAMGFKASGPIGRKVMDDHKKTGIVLLALYLTQCLIGALIHFVKPKNATRRPPQNYFHAVFGLAIIALSMYQIRTGYNHEWPTYTGLTVPNGVNTLWMVWVVILPVMYAVGLLFLKKQYRQEEESRKGWKNDDDMNDRYHDQ